MAVRPRDAASLALVRRDGATWRVLLGRRVARHRFAPDMFVFPGGRLDAADRAPSPHGELKPATLAAMARHSRPAMARALAVAAVRETVEETGLAVPGLAALDYLGRAITPSQSPIRFHARFFIADAAAATGTIGGSGELVDLDWYPLAAALRLPLVDITEFMLHEIGRRLANPPPRAPVYLYRGMRPVIRHE
jgi:8-oxo-dGTP pyrophosphatase MutT (NUDIX family)